MTTINCLPYSVIDEPLIGCLDVHPDVYPKVLIRITDARGKVWYLRTIGRDRYEWTRSQCFARRLSIAVARKHADIIAGVWKAIADQEESN